MPPVRRCNRSAGSMASVAQGGVSSLNFSRYFGPTKGDMQPFPATLAGTKPSFDHFP
ncbi:hypothetical protein NXC24_CH00822 [Rhizobium sp. NXC24]|nr:hypothetical protein NXC24_CH00822 [Rhizobium sp. NXC24]